MKYSKGFLKRKSKKELIEIILKQNLSPISTLESFAQIRYTVADGTKGMTRGE